MNNRPIIALLIIILVVSISFNLHTLNQINQLENAINNINYTYNSMENRLSSIDHSINNTLTTVEKEQQWIRSNTIDLVEFIDYLPNRKEVKAEFTIELNEIQTDENLYLKITGNSTDELIPLENYQEDLICHKTINLGVDENYEFTLIGETREKTRSRALDDLQLKNMFNNIVSVEPRINRYSLDANNHYDELDFHIVIEKNNVGYPIFEDYVKALSIEKAQAKIYSGETLVETLDLFNPQQWEAIRIQNEDNVREEAVREHQKMGYYREVLLDVDGQYTFEEQYQEKPYLRMIVEIEDNQGNQYTREMDVH